MRYDYQQDKIIKVSDASSRFNVEGGQYIPKSFITDTRVRDKKRLEKVGNLVKNSYLYR